jgi:hypothetical protein
MNQTNNTFRSQQPPSGTQQRQGGDYSNSKQTDTMSNKTTSVVGHSQVSQRQSDMQQSPNTT